MRSAYFAKKKAVISRWSSKEKKKKVKSACVCARVSGTQEITGKKLQDLHKNTHTNEESRPSVGRLKQQEKFRATTNCHSDKRNTNNAL